MGSKAIIPAALGVGAIIASGGLAAPAVAGAAASGGAAAGATGLLGAEALGGAAAASTTGAVAAPIAEGAVAGNFMTPYAAETLGGMQAIPTATAAAEPASAGLLDTTVANGGLDAANSGAVANGTWDTRLAGLKDMAGKYGTVDNTIGAAKLMAAMPTNQNRPQASSASPTPAKQMEKALTAGLLDSYGDPSQYTPKKQRFSLLG